MTHNDRGLRVIADFSPEAWCALEEIAETLHTSKIEALRRAIGLMQFALREKKKGHRIIIEEPESGEDAD